MEKPGMQSSRNSRRGVEDNLTLQVDEIEALTAIYCDDWHVEDAENRVYSITIGGGKTDEWIRLQVTLPPEYPSLAPPTYQLSAPWMNRQDKQELSFTLEEIYCKHPGESIIYRWIEQVREFVNKAADIRQQEAEDSDDNNGNDSPDSMNAPLLSDNISPTFLSKELPEIHHGQPITDRHSTFQAHMAKVASVEQVRLVMANLMENRKVASATHNISAYRIYLDLQQCLIQDCDDDGETHAGSRLLHLLQILDVQNVLVVVSRWFGGTLLGPDRFKHINNAARSILQEHGYIAVQKDSTAAGELKKKKSK